MTSDVPVLIPELLRLFEINRAFLSHMNLSYHVVVQKKESESRAEGSYFTHLHLLFFLPVTQSVTLFIFLNLTNKDVQAINQLNSNQSSIKVNIFDDQTEKPEEELIRILKELEPEIFSDLDDVRVRTAVGSSTEVLHFSIIDDDQISRSFLSEFIAQQNWGSAIDIEAFREGQSFFESNRLEKPGKHIVLLENILPRMTGLEIVKRIREIYSTDAVSIMMLSGRNREGDALSAFKFGVNDFMEKPIRIRELAVRIMNMTKRMSELVYPFN